MKTGTSGSFCVSFAADLFARALHVSSPTHASARTLFFAADEFGHMLGLQHEHATIPADKLNMKAILSYHPQWSEEKVKSAYTLTEFSNFGGFDGDSIMCYFIPKHFIKGAQQDVGGKHELSKNDIEGIKRLYYLPDLDDLRQSHSPLAPPPVGSPVSFNSAGRKVARTTGWDWRYYCGLEDFFCDKGCKGCGPTDGCNCGPCHALTLAEGGRQWHPQPVNFALNSAIYALGKRAHELNLHMHAATPEFLDLKATIAAYWDGKKGYPAGTWAEKSKKIQASAAAAGTEAAFAFVQQCMGIHGLTFHGTPSSFASVPALHSFWLYPTDAALQNQLWDTHNAATFCSNHVQKETVGSLTRYECLGHK